MSTYTGWIYALVDSRDSHAYRYVGKTHRSLSRRLRDHRKTTHETYTGFWIRSVLTSGARVEIVELEQVASEQRLNERECEWIAALREAGYRLTNTAPGGQGGYLGPEVAAKISAASRLAWTPERRQRQSEMMRMSWLNGERTSAGLPREARSRGGLNNPWTEEARQKIADAWTPERRAAQADLARAIPNERRVAGGSTPWTTERKAKAKNSWTPERRAAQARRMQELNARKKES